MDEPTKQVFEPSTGSSVILNAAENEALRKEAAEAEAKKMRLPGWWRRLSHRWGQVPSKKRKVIGFSTIGVAGGLAALIVVLNVVTAVAVSYGESYRVARELRPEIEAIRSNYDCQRVIDYVSSPYNNMVAFSEYVEGCKKMGSSAEDLVESLGRTEGVRRNSEVGLKYDSFYNSYEAVMAANQKLEPMLDVYSLWHQFIVAATGVDGWDETDADLEATAKILTDSNVEVFRTYGEGWLQKKLAAAIAYRNYYTASFTAPDKEELRVRMVEAQKEFTDYKAGNEPNLKETYPLKVVDSAGMYGKFGEMYALISDLYETHYESGSGDCKELVREVICS